MCSRNPSVGRRSILRPGNISSALHSDRSSCALLTATKPIIAPLHGTPFDKQLLPLFQQFATPGDKAP